MSDQPDTRSIPSTLTGEYKRIGVGVKDNFGLTEAVAVNALTGVMHAICTHGAKTGFACECPSYMQAPDGPAHLRHQKESERETVFAMSSTWCNYAIIKSMSAIGLRACRNCERVLKNKIKRSNSDEKEAHFDGSTSAPNSR